MPEMKDVMESEAPLEWLQPGFRLTPVPSADVPNRAIFLNSDGATNKLCFKDGDGVVRRFRMANL